MFYYGIIYPIDEVLYGFNEEHKTYIIASLEHIRGNCTTRILEYLKKRGMLLVCYFILHTVYFLYFPIQMNLNFQG